MNNEERPRIRALESEFRKLTIALHDADEAKQRMHEVLAAVNDPEGDQQ